MGIWGPKDQIQLAAYVINQAAMESGLLTSLYH